MISFSLCMVTKNQEKLLESCLLSIHDLFDEIIIVDIGSTDQTKNVARKFTNNIYDFISTDDKSIERTFTFQLATKDYIFWLDANDFIKEEDKAKIKSLKETLDSFVDSVSVICNEKLDQDDNVICSQRQNRLIKRSSHHKWEGLCHNELNVDGRVLHSDICIYKKGKDVKTEEYLQIYKKHLERGEVFGPIDTFYYAKELYDNNQYEEAAHHFKHILETENMDIEYKLYACGMLSDYYLSRSNMDKTLKYILKSFEYDIPRAEFCCRLGSYFLITDELDKAIFWNECATSLKRPENSFGYFNDSCWKWAPLVQLCICYLKKGEYRTAYEYNEKALSFIPSNQSMLSNKIFLEKFLSC